MNFSQDRKTGKNVTGITIVVLLHILVAYGIVTGLGKRLVSKMVEPVETKIIEEAKLPPPKDLPPPPPPPEIKAPPPPFIPPVEVNVTQAPVVQNVIATSTAQKPANNELVKVLPAAAPATAKSVRIAAVADFSSCEKPVYPKASQRNEETGTVTLSFLVGADGRVADSKVLKSSGFRDLDKAAQNGIGKCVFKPGSVDGKPEQAWMSMQYVWNLD